MNHGEIIREVMKETKTTQAQLSKLCGCKSQSVISERLNHDNISIKTMLEMLEAMGYEMTVQPKGRGKRKEGQFVISVGGEQE